MCSVGLCAARWEMDRKRAAVAGRVELGTTHKGGGVFCICPPHHAAELAHTTALHLLQSGVDLTMIRSWLGHASVQTTSGYVEIDLEMKRKTLKSCEKLIPKGHKPRASWRRDDDLLSWLSKL